MGFTNRGDHSSGPLNVIGVYTIRGDYMPLPAKVAFLGVVFLVQLRRIVDLLDRLLNVDPGGPKVALSQLSSTRSNSQKKTFSSSPSSVMARRSGAIARIGARTRRTT